MPGMPKLPRILVPTDIGPQAQKIYAHAVRIGLQRGARVVLLHVTDGPPKEVQWERLVTVRELLTTWGMLEPGASVEDFEALGFRVSVEAVWEAEPVRAIARLAEDSPPWMMVLGSHQRRGIDRLFRGSVSEPAARLVGVPTLVLPDSATGFVSAATGEVRLRKVLVPLGGELDGAAVRDVAERFVAMMGGGDCELVLMHVDTLQPEARFEFPQPGELRTRCVSRQGDIVPAILREAAHLEADLIVMPTRGHDSPVDGLFGSRTERVVRSGASAVLTLPVGWVQG